MLDPLPPPPAFLVSLTKPLADRLNLHTLPLHIHEVLLAAFIYTFICTIVSPVLSARLCPQTYPRLSRRARLNWDVHVVSFAQACIINGLSLYAIWFDEERKSWRGVGAKGQEWNDAWEGRLWGYYGFGGLCQSFALGYFLWDLCVCASHVSIFGWGMVAHAVSAVAVFGLGYRPFIYFSAPIFLLYELSSPFLNIHWFCDKLHLTGSIYQAINGVFLVLTFFSCRLVWGIYSSTWVFHDMFHLVRTGHSDFVLRVPSGQLKTYSTEELLRIARDREGQTTAFNYEQYTPLWIPIVYFVSNLVLNSLNLFWFSKMIQTIRTRFEPPWGTKGVGPDKVHYQPVASEDEDSDLGIGEPGKVKDRDMPDADEAKTPAGKGSIKDARERAEHALNGSTETLGDTRVAKGVNEDGGATVEVSGTARKSARSRRKG
ncbi:uncharacterized protein LTR77_000791 [Saxophila tyrrhenica]|uniref:TLC domain-containing protein n=1 Tax=Saxophila tyrrhenica TaxID=1690608 RepID=A0AAV9PPC7_9PEZI|nr:hypothetical protein LTR77_000791 [Saxophila tyrrhenica]